GGVLHGGDRGRVRSDGEAGASGDRLVCGQRANVELTVSNRGVDGAGGADGLGIGAVQGKDGASDHVGREVAAENFDILGGFAEDGQVGSSARGERCVAGGHSDGLGVEGLGEEGGTVRGGGGQAGAGGDILGAAEGAGGEARAVGGGQRDCLRGADGLGEAR